MIRYLVTRPQGTPMPCSTLSDAIETQRRWFALFGDAHVEPKRASTGRSRTQPEVRL